jgi:hypothetical protein
MSKMAGMWTWWLQWVQRLRMTGAYLHHPICPMACRGTTFTLYALTTTQHWPGGQLWPSGMGNHIIWYLNTKCS